LRNVLYKFKTYLLTLLYVYVGLPVQPTKAAWSPWPLTFWPWKWCPGRVWRGLPLCQF